MVAAEFMSQLEQLRFVESTGLDDFADRCSYLLSFIVLVMCFTIVTLKSYVFEPMSCYAATTYSGSGMGSYINAFCWVNGTVPANVDTERLEDSAYWDELEKKKLSYYQWVSLMLAVQAILCYLPRLVWEMITFNRVGTNLTFLLESAKSASRETGKERSQRVQFVANALDTLLFARRKMHHREDTRHPVVQFLHSATDMLPRKRIGSALVFYYMHAKLLYLGNAVAQILLMERFLGLGSNYRFFGVSILQDLLSGRNWNETLVFPRVGFCRIPVKIVNSPIAPITAQCTLPVNMLNEKIYIFLWFWFVFVAALETGSIGVWIYRLAIRNHRLRTLIRFLKVADIYNAEMDPLLMRFERTFLRLDGNFLLHMLRLNAGEIVTQDILQAMLQRYKQQEDMALKANQQLMQPTKQLDYATERDQITAGLITRQVNDSDCTIKKRADT